ncbi:HdeD family acid-resistance protein [Glaciecola sp. SC05]|uniref:HdeD family acid-resistance protein n=1 Tax=Glaciecola sp. SC05 TaxID=1987355 RepID=UPI003528D6EB
MRENPSKKSVYKVPSLFGNTHKNWRWIMALGVLFIGLGTIGLGATATLTLVTVLFFGWLLIIGGLVQLVQVYRDKLSSNLSWHMFVAVLYLLAGSVVVYDPIGGAVALTVFIAIIFFALGAIRIIYAMQMRNIQGWWWPLIGGFASMILGAIIIAEWPSSALWVIGLFIALDLIINGWTYIMIALVAKQLDTHKDPN